MWTCWTKKATLHYTTQLWGEAWAGCWVLLGMNVRAGLQNGVSPKPPISSTRNQSEATRVLLSAGCGVDAQNSTRSTALHVAVQRGFLEVVKTLCERGCDVNLPVSDSPWVLWH